MWGGRLLDSCAGPVSRVVVRKDGIVSLELTPSVKDLEDEEDEKSFKSDQSIRTVPLHAAVIALGFSITLPVFVARARRSSSRRSPWMAAVAGAPNFQNGLAGIGAISG